MISRRRLLATCTGAAGTVITGCLSGAPGGNRTDASPAPCSATDPPSPTDAATSPRSYPERPTELTRSTVGTFLTAYAKAYQYNDALAADPNKIGRTNEFTVSVHSVSVASDDGRFTADVSGQLQSDITDQTSTATPETPTETPLPMGHGPFESTYTVTDRELRRGGVTVECW